MAGEAPDSLGLRAAALRSPDLVAGAAALVADSPVALPGRARIEQVLLLGAAEGELAARLVAAVVGPFLPVPVVRCSDFSAPAFAAEGTLALALSWAGEHPEVVEACTTGLAPGVPLVAVTGEGQLAEAARARGASVVPLPADVLAGRAATGALAAAAVGLLERAGLLPGADEWIRLAADQLTRRRDEVAGASDPFGTFGWLARRLAGTMPLVQGAGPVGGAAAASWASRVRLDARSPAWSSTMPALGHDEIAGWGQHGDVTRQVVSVVQLRHDHEHPSLAARFAAVDELMAEAVAGIHELRAAGDGTLAQGLDLVLQGDLVALAMAAEIGLDPGPQGVDLIG